MVPIFSPNRKILNSQTQSDFSIYVSRSWSSRLLVTVHPSRFPPMLLVMTYMLLFLIVFYGQLLLVLMTRHSNIGGHDIGGRRRCHVFNFSLAHSTFFTPFARVHLIDLPRRSALSTCRRLFLLLYVSASISVSHAEASRSLRDSCRKLTIREMYRTGGSKYFHGKAVTPLGSYTSARLSFSLSHNGYFYCCHDLPRAIQDTYFFFFLFYLRSASCSVQRVSIST